MSNRHQLKKIVFSFLSEMKSKIEFEGILPGTSERMEKRFGFC